MPETKDIKVSLEIWKEIKKYSTDTQISMREIAESSWKALKTQIKADGGQLWESPPQSPGETEGSRRPKRALRKLAVNE